MNLWLRITTGLGGALLFWQGVARAELITYGAPAMTVADCPAGQHWDRRPNGMAYCAVNLPPPSPPPPPPPPLNCPDPTSTRSYLELLMNRDASDNLWWESNLYWYGANRFHGGDSPDTDPNWLIDKIISTNSFVRGVTFVSFAGVQYRVALCQ